MYFCFPKKHIPMLFQSSAESGLTTAAVLYLVMAASWSLLSWMMEPVARMVLQFSGSKVSELPRN